MDGLGTAGGSKLVEGPGAVSLYGVLRNEKLRRDLAIAQAAGDQRKGFEFPCRDAEGLLLDRVGSEGFRGAVRHRDLHFPHHDRFVNGFALARDAQAEPNAKGREEDCDQRAVKLDRVFDDHEAVFRVLEGGDEKAAYKTEDEGVALHDGLARTILGVGPVVMQRGSVERLRIPPFTKSVKDGAPTASSRIELHPMRPLRTVPLLLCLIASGLYAASPILIPLTADHWHSVQDVDNSARPEVTFIGHEGFPQGAIVLKNGSVVLDSLSFRDGVIEFDMKATAQDIPGIQFRRHGEAGHQDGEEFYLRSFPECRASNDCIQYAPVIHGFMLWNSYPQYQTQAPILDGWNHFKLVISGRRMNVYINQSPQPILAVGNLESSSSEGLIQLRGPAVFANLTVTPGAVEGLSPQPTPDPTAADAGMVRQWQLGPQTPARFGEDPAFSQAPADTAWRPISAGRFGLVNLNREYELVRHAPSFTWLRTTVTSSVAQDKLVQLGWLGHVWVFVNGQLITQGKNFYEPDYERRPTRWPTVCAERQLSHTPAKRPQPDHAGAQQRRPRQTHHHQLLRRGSHPAFRRPYRSISAETSKAVTSGFCQPSL